MTKSTRFVLALALVALGTVSQQVSSETSELTVTQCRDAWHVSDASRQCGTAAEYTAAYIDVVSSQNDSENTHWCRISVGCEFRQVDVLGVTTVTERQTEYSGPLAKVSHLDNANGTLVEGHPGE